MKRKLLSGLLLVTLLMTVISANPTQSQKQQQGDIVPAAKSVDTVPPPLAGRITALEEKARGLEKSLDSDMKRTDRMLYHVSTLEARQGKILATFEKRNVLLLDPISDVEIKATPEKPEIKPVKPSRPSWWKRVFGQ